MSEFDLGCFFHGYEGDITQDNQPYKTCFECGHIWWTSEQMLTESNDSMKNDSEIFNTPIIMLYDSVDEIFFCCWCAHDF